MAQVDFYLPYDMSKAQVFVGQSTFISSQIIITGATKTAVYYGSFSYPGNVVTGVLTGYDEFHNGQIAVSARGLAANATAVMGEVYRGNVQGAFATAFTGSDTFSGTNGADLLIGYGGPDVFYGRGGNDILDGRDSIDTAVFSGRRSDYVISSVSASQKIVLDKVDGRDGADNLFDMEILVFSDAVVVYDTGGLAAAGYRMYQAAFARTPDKAGLSYWVDKLMSGVSLRDVAYGFVQSPEFLTAYGAAPSNAQIVNKLYLNVLGRAGEKSGFDYWVGELDRGTPLIDVLAGFANSAENVAKVAPAFAAGVELELYALL